MANRLFFANRIKLYFIHGINIHPELISEKNTDV